MFFEKISLEQWKKDVCDLYYSGKNFSDINLQEQENIVDSWNNIKLPKRASIGSAGYDFYVPYFVFSPCDSAVKVLTGIRWVVDRCEQNKVLMLFPRSGLGCKYGMRLMNTVGVIDADYWESDNEGHIMAIITSDGIELDNGKAFMQGVILPFDKINNDNTIEHRNGGFGSSDKR